MNCPVGRYSAFVEDGAKSYFDGCTACIPGLYSVGGKVTGCTEMSCPAGKIATKSGSVSQTDGCTECETGK